MIQELSIIIPTLNEEKYVPHLLASISQQHFQGKLEVILVDGHSTDNTKKVANTFRNKIKNLSIISSKRGVSRQRNTGARNATYKYYLFLDADTILPDNFLEKLAKKIDQKEKQFVGLPLILPYQGTFVDYAMVTIAYNFFILVGKFKPLVAGMCLITTKDNHKKIKGFNEKIIYGEDMDYGLRSVASGAQYHLYARLHLFASARRGRKMGRRNLGRIWLSWYLQLIRKGSIANQSVNDYPYGYYT